MHRIDDKKDGGDRLAGLSPAVSGPPGPTSVIQFRRGNPPPAPAAEVSPPEASAHFLPIGPVTQAVVMRLKDNRVRLRVLAPATGGGDGQDEP